MKYSGKIIISDIDGTFTGSAEGVKKNIAAIERFKAQGGLFTFASGRVEYTIKSVVPEFFELVNAPAVLANGSYLYDAEKDIRLNEICIDTDFALPYVKAMLRDMPSLGVRINRRKTYITPEINPTWNGGLNGYFDCVESYPLDEMPRDGWNKIVFMGKHNEIIEASDYVLKTAKDKFAVSLSCPTLLELLDPTATKGNQVRYLKALLGEGWTTYCVGDFENDEDMLRKADVSVAPCSGMKKIVDMADMVACHCADGAIAWLVDHI